MKRESILIDTPPDLRSQILQVGYRDLAAVFYTHAHADHINGIDDLRPFNFRMQRELIVYADDTAAEQIETMFSYAFHTDPGYEGGAPPKLKMIRVNMFDPVAIAGVNVIPLPIMHGSKQITGYRISNFAYLTDCSEIPPETEKALKNLELLVISGLRYRDHKTHFTLDGAVEAINKLSPARALLTHISHEVEHTEAEEYIRRISSCEVGLAYDGLSLDIN